MTKAIYAICFSCCVLIFCSTSFAQVTWDTAGDGNWEDGANWSTGIVPQPTEDVVIDQGGGFLITVGASVPAINTLNSEEDLAITDGNSLTISNGGTLNGAFTHGINSSLTVDGGTLTTNGTTTFDGGNLFANGGSTMDVSNVTSYVTDTGSNNSRTFRANDGSTFDFSGLTDLTGGGFIRTLNVNANSGSSIDMSALTNYNGGSTRFDADGAGSSIDLNMLTLFNNTNANNQARVEVSNGATINASSMTTIQSASSAGNLFRVNGAGSTITAGALTDVINTRLELINGGTHDFSGVTNFFGSGAKADSGVTLDLTGVTSYDTNGGGNGSRFFEADGAGTQIDLSNLTTVQGGGFIRTLNVNATNGASIDMSSLNNYTGGATDFVADGAGSSIDINSLATLNNDNANTQASLEAKNGGTVDANMLTTIQAADANRGLLRVDGAASTLNIGALTDAINTRVQLTNGGTHDFSGITNLLGSDAFADSGVTLDLTGVTSYDTNGGGNGSRNNSSDGAGTKIDLSNVATAVGGSFIRRWNNSATDGGEIDLSGLAEITTGAARFTADGVGSLIDLSALQNFSDDNNNVGSSITAINGGEVRLDINAASNLSFTGVDMTIDSGGTINTSRIVQYTEGTFTSNGVDQTLGLNDANSSSFIANGGAEIDLTSLTGAFDNTSSQTSFTSTVRANGAGSEVDMSNVSSMSTGVGVIGSTINLEALDGGLVDASGVTSLSSPGGIVNSSRPINVTANGTGSRVDLSSLLTFTDIASVSSSLIQSADNGQVDFGSGDVVMTNVDIDVSSGGTVLANSIELISMEINSSGDDDDFAVLHGDGGTVTADVINTSGIVGPGASPGILTIDGNYFQGVDGLLDLEIDSLTLFDQLVITGNAAFDGNLALTIDDGFDLMDNMDFVVVTIGGIQTGMFSGLSQGSTVASDNGFDLKIDYLGGDGNDIRLTTSNVAVPEPSTTLFLTVAAIGFVGRRKRS